MVSCCELRKNRFRTFEGEDDEELRALLERGWDIENPICNPNEVGKIHQPHLEVLFRCPRCGQLWTWHEEGAGHSEYSVYEKISLENAKQKFSDAKL